jgi:hypothetical protein
MTQPAEEIVPTEELQQRPVRRTSLSVGAHFIRVLDLNTHKVSTLQRSRGLYAARWSPDGRYIMAMPSDSLS